MTAVVVIETRRARAAHRRGDRAAAQPRRDPAPAARARRRARPRRAPSSPAVLRPRGDLPRDGDGLGPAADLAGVGLHDDAVSIPVVGVQHRTLLAFLSSGCLTCRGFWDAFAGPRRSASPPTCGSSSSPRTRPRRACTRCASSRAPDLAVVMSNAAWEHYTVPGLAVLRARRRRRRPRRRRRHGRVVGSRCRACSRTPPATKPTRLRSPAAARPPPRRASTASSLAHGIHPGDPRLYRTADELDPGRYRR